MAHASMTQYPPQTVEKVERMLDVLEGLGDHPFLRGKLALHGGTAINLFMLDVPRLSVDIDVSYVGMVEMSAMLEERPLVERSIGEVGKSLGFSVSGGAGGHAGRTFVLGYRSPWGPDHVKVDCIYMNRSPLPPLAEGGRDINPTSHIPGPTTCTPLAHRT